MAAYAPWDRVDPRLLPTGLTRSWARGRIPAAGAAADAVVTMQRFRLASDPGSVVLEDRREGKLAESALTILGVLPDNAVASGIRRTAAPKPSLSFDISWPLWGVLVRGVAPVAMEVVPVDRGVAPVTMEVDLAQGAALWGLAPGATRMSRGDVMVRWSTA
mmetsp:Transcript_67829/g.199216  ORF Transcript_67829/g.199216 Transcript_67829/m.199216 type:complete len:161 (+) Transcript_67829:184-666(+)